MHKHQSWNTNLTSSGFRSIFRPHPRLGFFTRLAHFPSWQHIYGSRPAQGYCMNDVGEVSTALSPEAKILLADSAQERLPPGSNLKELVCLRIAQYPTIHWFINHQFPNSDGHLGDIHHFQTQPIGGKDWSRSWLRSWNQKTICWQSKQIYIKKNRVTPPTDTLRYLAYSDFIWRIIWHSVWRILQHSNWHIFGPFI